MCDFCRASRGRGNLLPMIVKEFARDKCTVLFPAVWLQSSYVFVRIRERREAVLFKKATKKKRKNRSWNPIYISGYHPFFFFFFKKKRLKESQEISKSEFLPVSLGTCRVCVCVCVCGVCVRIQQQCSFVFSSCLNCFPSKYSQPCQLTEQVSSGSAAWMRARLAWTKVLIQALVHCKEYSSVCVMCRCVFERPRCFVCVCCSREREARRCVFTHAWSIHSPITAVSTHTHTHAG